VLHHDIVVFLNIEDANDKIHGFVIAKDNPERSTGSSTAWRRRVTPLRLRALQNEQGKTRSDRRRPQYSWSCLAACRGRGQGRSRGRVEEG
jgi:hypothetical protein